MTSKSEVGCEALSSSLETWVSRATGISQRDWMHIDCITRLINEYMEADLRWKESSSNTIRDNSNSKADNDHHNSNDMILVYAYVLSIIMNTSP